jgi:hypothetical protein
LYEKIYVFTSTRNESSGAAAEEDAPSYDSLNSCWNLSQNQKLVSLQSRKTLKQLVEVAETIDTSKGKKKTKKRKKATDENTFL